MAKVTRAQIALSTLVADGLMDKTPTRSIAERADLIVRWMLQEPDVVRRALGDDPDQRDSIVASAVTGSQDDYSYLDGEDD